MAVVGWIGAEMEVVACRQAEKGRGVIACREMPEHFPSAR